MRITQYASRSTRSDLGEGMDIRLLREPDAPILRVHRLERDDLALVHRLATEALQQAIYGEREAAAHTVQRISNETGGEGVHLALLGWCDAYIRYEGIPEGAIVAIGFQAEETGVRGDARVTELALTSCAVAALVHAALPLASPLDESPL